MNRGKLTLTKIKSGTFNGTRGKEARLSLAPLTPTTPTAPATPARRPKAMEPVPTTGLGS